MLSARDIGARDWFVGTKRVGSRGSWSRYILMTIVEIACKRESFGDANGGGRPRRADLSDTSRPERGIDCSASVGGGSTPHAVGPDHRSFGTSSMLTITPWS